MLIKQNTHFSTYGTVIIEMGEAIGHYHFLICTFLYYFDFVQCYLVPIEKGSNRNKQIRISNIASPEGLKNRIFLIYEWARKGATS